MKVYAVVPVKHLAASKSRLSSILNPENRKRLTLVMLEDVLTAIKYSTIEKTVIVGSDLRVAELAVNAGVAYLNEEVNGGLNCAIGFSIEWCRKEGADSVLVLPADVPFLSSIDIDRIIGLSRGADSVMVLSPSENGGTNALCLRPPNLIPVSFGRGSFKRHIRIANNKGIQAKLYYSSSLAFDIDTQRDLERLSKTSGASLTSQFIAQILRN
jgi:2-phospho-L-lactate guanylyltransferase